MTFCSELTRDGARCRRLVRIEGERCYAHASASRVAPDPPIDAEDADAVNLWLRRMAIRALHSHYKDTGGAVKPQTYDYFRRAIQSLTAEHHDRHPPRAADDPIADMRSELDAVKFN